MPSMSAVEQHFCRSLPWQVFTRRIVLPWALQGVHPAGGLLELGGGSGAMAEQTAQAFPELQITVTDIDPKMVTAVQRRLSDNPNVTARQADVTELPFESNSFDTVTSYLMLHHVIQWPLALAEAARVLRPGGTLAGYDLGDTRVADWIHRADRSPYRLIPCPEYRPALERAGMDNIHIRGSWREHVVRFLAQKAA